MPDVYLIYASVRWWSCSSPGLAHIRQPGKSWAIRLSILAHELGKWGL